MAEASNPNRALSIDAWFEGVATWGRRPQSNGSRESHANGRWCPFGDRLLRCIFSPSTGNAVPLMLSLGIPRLCRRWASFHQCQTWFLYWRQRRRRRSLNLRQRLSQSSHRPPCRATARCPPLTAIRVYASHDLVHVTTLVGQSIKLPSKIEQGVKQLRDYGR